MPVAQYSLLGTTALTGTFTDTAQTNLGMRFHVTADCVLVAIKYWRPSGDTGPTSKPLALWRDSDSVQLWLGNTSTEVTGWNTISVPHIPLSAGVAYVAAYHSQPGVTRSNGSYVPATVGILTGDEGRWLDDPSFLKPTNNAGSQANGVDVIVQTGTAGEVLPDNGLTSTISAGISATTTSIPIQTADAPSWPITGTYRAVLWQDATSGPWELVKIVDGWGTPNLVVQRAAEMYHGDQTARAWPSGTGIAAVLTKDGLNGVIGTGGGGSAAYDVSGSHISSSGWSDPTSTIASLAIPPGATGVYFGITVTANSGTPNDGLEMKIFNETANTDNVTVHLSAGSAPAVGFKGSSYSAIPAGCTQFRFIVGIWNIGSNPGTVSYDYAITWSIPGAGAELVIEKSDSVPANGATTVVLAHTPETVFMVSRNGVVQSAAAGHYSLSAATLTFAASFNGTDRVVVGYSVRVGPATTPGILTTDVVPANAATTVTLSQAPDTLFMVARNGVVQSAAAGHYSLSGSTLTFAAAFNGTDRVVASYSVGTAVDNPLRTYIRHVMGTIDPGGPP